MTWNLQEYCNKQKDRNILTDIMGYASQHPYASIYYPHSQGKCIHRYVYVYQRENVLFRRSHWYLYELIWSTKSFHVILSIVYSLLTYSYKIKTGLPSKNNAILGNYVGFWRFWKQYAENPFAKCILIVNKICFVHVWGKRWCKYVYLIRVLY